MKFEINELLKINFMVDGNFDLINATSNLKFDSVLDIGLGEGGASTYFALKGKKVTALGLDIESYNYPRELFSLLKVKTIETTFEDFETNEKFDLIWASHVLEHVLNTGLFLEKCYSLLSDEGWLCIMVPPYKDKVVGGHINNGWNMGQLMYNLLLTGYDIKNGHFIKHGYNICAFVQKSKEKLPNIRMDIGDIESTKHLWPIEVKQGFDGNIERVNWFNNFKQYENEKNTILNLKKEIEEKNEKIEQQKKEIEEKNEKIEQQKKEIEEKNEKIEQQKKEIEEKNEKNFDTREIEYILNSLKDQILEEKDKLLEKNKKNLKYRKSLFQIYEESILMDFMQPIKQIPLLGKSLLWFKHKILKWDR